MVTQDQVEYLFSRLRTEIAVIHLSEV